MFDVGENPVYKLMDALRTSYMKAIELAETIENLKQYDGRPEMWNTIQSQLEIERKIQDEIKTRMGEEGLWVRIFLSELGY